MKRTIFVTLAVATLAGPCLAESGTVNGAVGGAVTGAVVGGPVGAAVGGVAGAIVGTAIDPPPEKVVTYVREQPLPPTSTVVEDPIVVGKPLPSQVVVTPVPDDPHYGYVVIGQQRVIVEPQSRKVVQVIQ